MTRVIALVMALLLAGPVAAHEPQRSYLTLHDLDSQPRIELRLDLRDIDMVIPLDLDLDGTLQAGEVQAKATQIAAYVGQSLAISGATPCGLHSPAQRLVSQDFRTELVLDYRLDCRFDDGAVILSSRLFATVAPDHRVFVKAGAANAVLDGTDRPITVLAAQTGSGRMLWQYFRLGVLHMVEGIDHILFVLVLILPILRQKADFAARIKWAVAPITGFTLGHAITLTASLTDVLLPPVPLIEVLIALSITLTALFNLVPRLAAYAAAISAFFGTIHGFGFAAALGSIDLTGGALALAIFGFNIGLEVAQIGMVVIATACLAMVFRLRLVFLFASAGLAAIGMLWFVERLAAL